MTQMNKLLENIPEDLSEEVFETLIQTENTHIERIVSRGHTSPETGWYDQDRNEFVLLLSGAARLAFEDGREVSLEAGDCLDISAHVKHRVAWTAENRETVWLAIHYR